MELPMLALSTASPEVPLLYLRQIKRLVQAILHFKAGHQNRQAQQLQRKIHLPVLRQVCQRWFRILQCRPC